MLPDRCGCCVVCERQRGRALIEECVVEELIVVDAVNWV